MKDKRIIIGSDHGGYELKSYIIEQLKDEYEINDVGTHSLDSCDYPIFAREKPPFLKFFLRIFPDF